MSHRHAYAPALDPRFLRCANARFGCDAPQIPATPRSALAVRDSETSQEAARRQQPTKLHKDRLLVYQALLGSPDGLTDEELVERTGLLANTARPRRIDLVADGAVVDSGRVRLTRSGRKAVIWVVAT